MVLACSTCWGLCASCAGFTACGELGPGLGLGLRVSGWALHQSTDDVSLPTHKRVSPQNTHTHGRTHTSNESPQQWSLHGRDHHLHAVAPSPLHAARMVAHDTLTRILALKLTVPPMLLLLSSLLSSTGSQFFNKCPFLVMPQQNGEHAAAAADEPHAGCAGATGVKRTFRSIVL